MDVIPRVDASDDKVPFQTILDLYETHRCVHVVNAAAAARPRQGRWLSEIARLERLGHAAGTFNVENDAATTLTPRETLGGAGARLPPWYASFVLGDGAATRAALRRFPRGGLDGGALPGVAGGAAHHGDHAWFFVGDNRRGAAPLRGRAEHTDALAPEIAGTWHLQLSGTKVWYVRRARDGAGDSPARKRRRAADAPATAVAVRRGDALFVDTRRWRHRTELPVEDEVSISCARDFSFGAAPGDGAAYANVDAVVATAALDVGDVVLREDDLPDCALPRLADANCAVAEDDEGNLCLVATKPIDVGDALAVPPSDDEDESDDDDDEVPGAGWAGRRYHDAP